MYNKGIARCQVKFDMQNWKKEVFKSQAKGRSHGDTVPHYNDIDGLYRQFKGHTIPRVSAINIYTDGQYGFGYEFEYHGGVRVGTHIGSHAHRRVKCMKHKLDPGEYIVGVGGRFGDYCDQMNFTLSSGRVIKGGGMGGGPVQADTSQAQKPYVLAIGVGLGGHIHHFFCHYIDLAKQPFKSQISK